MAHSAGQGPDSHAVGLMISLLSLFLGDGEMTEVLSMRTMEPKKSIPAVSSFVKHNENHEMF